MLRTAGFHHIEETDITADYLSILRAWLEQASRREQELRPALGDGVFDDRQSDRRGQITAVEHGLLRRSLVVCDTG